MEHEKITYLKEKQIKQKAKEDFEKFSNNENMQNPINAKFRAFQKTKKEIDFKDLF